MIWNDQKAILRTALSATVLLSIGLTGQALSAPGRAPNKATAGTSWENTSLQPLGGIAQQAMAASLRTGGQSSFSATTSAKDCASTCHVDALEHWGDAVGSDMDPMPVWDKDDESGYDSGDTDPYDTTDAGSAHSLAWTDYEFQYIYHGQLEPLKPVCQRCHVPESAVELSNELNVTAPSTRGLNAANVNEGVTCVSCHLNSNNEILGDKAFSLEDTGGAHEVFFHESFDGSTLCASCHNEPLYGALTKTVDEWSSAVGDGGGPTCVDCHMTDRTTGEVEHNFAGGHSYEFVSGALQVQWSNPTTSREPLMAKVANVGAFHNVPTGDKYRSYLLAVSIVDVFTGEVVREQSYTITSPIRTPLELEYVFYDQVDPIPYGEAADLDFGSLDPGSYLLEWSLTYYLIKPTIVLSLTKPHFKYVDPFGETVVDEAVEALEIVE